MTNAETVYVFIGALIAASLLVLLILWIYIKLRKTNATINFYRISF
jgi:hypothetical protein